MDHREASEEIWGGGMVVFIADGNYGGGGIWGDWGLHPKEAEHGHAIYCNMTNYGPLQEVCAEYGALGFS